jgi:preprotein translocase subunit SecG
MPTNNMRKQPLDLLLVVLSAVCILLMIKTSSDPLMSVLSGSNAASYLGRFATGNETIFNLCVGIFASILMFFLVVRLPEFWKRRRLRNNLARAQIF